MEMVGEIGRTEESHLFAGPSGKEDIVLECKFAGFLLASQGLGDFEHGSDPRGIVVGPTVDTASFLIACEA